MPRTAPPTSRPKAPAAPVAPVAPARAGKPKHVKQTFTLAPWTGENEGEKVIVYGRSGVGKTTLCALIPDARFIGLDDGGRKIVRADGSHVQHVTGVHTFQDVLDALTQDSLWPKGSSVVIDTLTLLEDLAEPYIFANIPHEKGGTVSHLEGYGYGKGYVHLYETMRLVLVALDRLVARGVNVIGICQLASIKQANAGGLDYLYEGPKLCHPSSEKSSFRLCACEWADHVVRVGYLTMLVSGDKDARVGKAQGTTDRTLYVHPEPHFFAKSRSLTDPVISFENTSDDSLWQELGIGK